MPLKRSTLWGSFLVLIFTLFLGITASNALPPGGANTVNTPGTISTVSPGNLKAGDTLNFTLTGFPANEQVYVKVDNGNACPSDSAQGACVVHQQKSDSNGQVRGSFVLSKQLAEGPHTLRFLSTEIVKDKDGQQIGTKGFSNESPVFTISGVNEKSSGGSQVNVDPNVLMTAPETTQKPVEKKREPSEETASATATTTVSASKNPEVNTANQENTSKESEFPWLGVIVLSFAVIIAGFVFYSRRRNQYQK